MTTNIDHYCQTVSENFSKLSLQSSRIEHIARLILNTVNSGNKILFCGNGGSAADAQHIAAELMGRYKREREPVHALALTVDTSVLTAVANDYGFADIFSRQIKGLGSKGDILIAISTSGNSENILAAISTAENIGMTTIGLTGEDGGAMNDTCSYILKAPSMDTNHIQEMHIAIGHMICGLVEENLS